MYPHSASGVVAASTLPFTGYNVLWALLVAITLITIGLGINRLVPRKEA